MLCVYIFGSFVYVFQCFQHLILTLCKCYKCHKEYHFHLVCIVADNGKT